MTIPYTTIAAIGEFGPTTVHSDTAHNAPHSNLLANDNNLQSQITSLSSTVSGLSGYSITSISQLAAVPSSYSFPANGAVNALGSYSKLSSTSTLLICIQGNLLLETQNMSSASPLRFGFYTSIDGSVLNGGAAYVKCAGDAFESVSCPVAVWRIATGLSSGSRTIQVQWLRDGALAGGSLTEMIIDNISYLVVELDSIV